MTHAAPLRSAATPTEGVTARYVLELMGVHHRYGPIVALPPVTLRLRPGAVCAVTGPNGSGKTTLLRVAAGLLQPSSGLREAQGRAIYAAAGGGARPSQTVQQGVAFAAALGGGDGSQALALTGLDDLRGSRVATLSAGQRTRVALAVALAGNAAVVCLDEPDAHLDDLSRLRAAAAIAHMADRGAAVLVATHDRRWLGDHAELALPGAGGRT